MLTPGTHSVYSGSLGDGGGGLDDGGTGSVGGGTVAGIGGGGTKSVSVVVGGLQVVLLASRCMACAVSTLIHLYIF